jgi:hypothetical protein
VPTTVRHDPPGETISSDAWQERFETPLMPQMACEAAAIRICDASAHADVGGARIAPMTGLSGCQTGFSIGG